MHKVIPATQPHMHGLLVIIPHYFIERMNRNPICTAERMAPSQYPKRRLSVRSRQVSKPRDLYLELSDHTEIWQALRQQCCRCACQISKRCDNLEYQSRGFETLRDLTKRRLFGYWDGALCLPPPNVYFYRIMYEWFDTICNNIFLRITFFLW